MVTVEGYIDALNITESLAKYNALNSYNTHPSTSLQFDLDLT